MPNSRSFKEYVSNRFYNEIFDAVAEYISDNADDLDLRLYRIRRSGEIELQDIYVRTVSVSDLPGSAISFDVALEAELYVHEADYHYDKTEGCRQWFMLRCHGDLACSLDDFAIDLKRITPE